jgi:predicted Zn-dependent peptidase
MLLNSRFDPGDVDKEREVIKEEVAMYLDQPQHQVQELLNQMLWPNHSLGRPITGTSKSLDGLTRERLTGVLKAHYLASNTAVVAAGRIRHRDLVNAFARFAPRFSKAALPPLAPVQSDNHQAPIALITKKTEQTQLALGVRTCSRYDKRRYALRLLNTILGENMSSRLFQIVREDLGLAYSIYSAPSFFEDTGDLVISAGLDTDKLPQTLKLILRELGRLVDAPPGIAELRRARDYAIGQIDLALEGTDHQMNWMGEQLLTYGRVFRAAEVKRHLHHVRTTDIRDVARSFFRPDHFRLALVSPRKSTADLHRLLRGSFQT